MYGNPDPGIREILLVEQMASGIWNPGLWIPEYSSKNPESSIWNPESKTALDSLYMGQD